MTDPISNSTTLRTLSFALDGLSLRQRAIAHNIANVDTPNYKAQHVTFEAELQTALKSNNAAGLSMQTTNPDHIDLDGNNSKSVSLTLEHQNNQLRNDGNNVDIDLEMTTLAETTLRYQALTQLAGMKLSLLKSIIREGR